jgi:hypothetical protein
MLGSDNSRKTPLVASLNTIAAQRAADAVFAQSREYPGRVESTNGQLVTASFQVFGQPFAGTSGTLKNVTVPIATSVYDWIPLQPQDLGVFKKSDVYLGGISGLGGGTADYTPRGNLSTLFFVPVSNKAWTVPSVANGDTAIRVSQGPHGFGAQDTQGNTTLLLDGQNSKVTVAVKNGATVVIEGTKVTITVPSGGKVIATAGGTPHPVLTETGPSPVLSADA